MSNTQNHYDYDHALLRLTAQSNLLGHIGKEIQAIAIHINGDTVEMIVFVDDELSDDLREELEYSLLMILAEFSRFGVLNEKFTLIKDEEIPAIEHGLWVYQRYGVRIKAGSFYQR